MENRLKAVLRLVLDIGNATQMHFNWRRKEQDVTILGDDNWQLRATYFKDKADGAVMSARSYSENMLLALREIEPQTCPLWCDVMSATMAIHATLNLKVTGEHLPYLEPRTDSLTQDCEIVSALVVQAIGILQRSLALAANREAA